MSEKLINITPAKFRCSIGACPAVYVDLTPAEHRCDVTASCPAVLSTEGRYVIIGKVIHDPDLAGRIGEGEEAVEISAEILLSSLGVTELMEAAEPIARRADRLDPARENSAIMVGVPLAELRALRSIIDRIKGGVNV